MIHTFYGFSQTPFAKDIPAQELLSTAAFAELSRRLDYMRTRLGLMLVLGEAGTGKTAAVRAFVEQLNASVYKLFYVPLSTVTPLDSLSWRKNSVSLTSFFIEPTAGIDPVASSSKWRSIIAGSIVALWSPTGTTSAPNHFMTTTQTEGRPRTSSRPLRIT